MTQSNVFIRFSKFLNDRECVTHDPPICQTCNFNSQRERSQPRLIIREIVVGLNSRFGHVSSVREIHFEIVIRRSGRTPNSSAPRTNPDSSTRFLNWKFCCNANDFTLLNTSRQIQFLTSLRKKFSYDISWSGNAFNSVCSVTKGVLWRRFISITCNFVSKLQVLLKLSSHTSYRLSGTKRTPNSSAPRTVYSDRK